jgi:hypothetical protein
LFPTAPECNYAISNASVATRSINGDPAGHGLSRRARQSADDASAGRRRAVMLLPLLVRNGRETLHEDVRIAAISESLVGRFLPQENFLRYAVRLPGNKSRFKKNESQGTGALIKSPAAV